MVGHGPWSSTVGPGAALLVFAAESGPGIMAARHGRTTARPAAAITAITAITALVLTSASHSDTQ